MQTVSADFDSVRRRIDVLRDDNARLRQNLERETSRLLQLRPRALDRDAAPSAPPVRDLTRRELEVLQGIAEGLSTKEISQRLGIAFKTAACHRHRLMQKLDVHGTGSLIRIAISSGLVRM